MGKIRDKLRRLNPFRKKLLDNLVPVGDNLYFRPKEGGSFTRGQVERIITNCGPIKVKIVGGGKHAGFVWVKKIKPNGRPEFFSRGIPINRGKYYEAKQRLEENKDVPFMLPSIKQMEKNLADMRKLDAESFKSMAKNPAHILYEKHRCLAGKSEMEIEEYARSELRPFYTELIEIRKKYSKRNKK